MYIQKKKIVQKLILFLILNVLRYKIMLYNVIIEVNSFNYTILKIVDSEDAIKNLLKSYEQTLRFLFLRTYK